MYTWDVPVSRRCSCPSLATPVEAGVSDSFRFVPTASASVSCAGFFFFSWNLSKFFLWSSEPLSWSRSLAKFGNLRLQIMQIGSPLVVMRIFGFDNPSSFFSSACLSFHLPMLAICSCFTLETTDTVAGWSVADDDNEDDFTFLVLNLISIFGLDETNFEVRNMSFSWATPPVSSRWWSSISLVVNFCTSTKGGFFWLSWR